MGTLTSHNTMKAVALAAQCLRPTTAVVRSFHNNMPTAFPKDSPYIEAMRQYKAELTGQRKIFQAAIDEQVSTRAQKGQEAVKEAAAQSAERRVQKAARGAEARALNRTMHDELRSAKRVRIRKGQKQFTKNNKHLQSERAIALKSLNAGSTRTIWSEEQIALSINEDSMRPYYPSFMWKPIEALPFSADVAQPEHFSSNRNRGPIRGNIPKIGQNRQ